jgi:hypothetical protein
VVVAGVESDDMVAIVAVVGMLKGCGDGFNECVTANHIGQCNSML